MRHLENVVGILVSSGHDPNWLVGSYSFEQLAFFARCIVQHRIDMLNLVIGPLVGSTGDGWKGHEVKADGAARKGSGRADGTKGRTFRMEGKTPQEKEDGLLQALGMVRTVRTAQAPSVQAPTPTLGDGTE